MGEWETSMRTVTFHANFVGVNGEERDMKGHNSKTINRNKSKLCFFFVFDWNAHSERAEQEKSECGRCDGDGHILPTQI